MTQAFLTTTRDERAACNNRLGPGAQHHPADMFYSVSYKVLDTPPKSLIPFQKVSGRRHETAKGLDLHYNDLDAFHRLHNRAYEKGAMRFDKMYSSHDDALTDPRVCRPLGAKAGGGGGGPVFQLRRGADPRGRYSGPQLTTFEVQQQGIQATYARDGGKSGPSMIPWTRMTSRQQRERGFKDDRMSSTNMPGLHISYKAVDFDSDKVVKFIPPSRPSTGRGRPGSAQATQGRDSRPQSASAAVRKMRDALEAQHDAEPLFATMAEGASTTATSAVAAATHSSVAGSPSRPNSALDGSPIRPIGYGHVQAPIIQPEAKAPTPFQLHRRPQSAGPRSTAAQQQWDPETCDPIAAFNRSKRVVSRNLSFSKASRWK